MIKRKLPANIYRCKGIIHAAETPGKRFVLQVVGRRADITSDKSWGDAKPQSRIVAIAHRASLNSDELKALFDGCLEPLDEPVCAPVRALS